MAADVKFASKYELRVQLVQDTLKKHAKMDDKEAYELAIHVLGALDKTREEIR
jgi:hypothetical protein